MIELVYTLVGGLGVWLAVIVGRSCDANESKQMRLGRLRCKLRMLVEKHRASLNKPSA
jgi:hypothetical protein